MHYFQKTFDLHSSVSYANASVRGRVLRKLPADVVPICHKCARAVERQAFHRAPPPIRWMIAIRPVNIIRSSDDGRLHRAWVVAAAAEPASSIAAASPVAKRHSTNRMIFVIH